METMSGGDLSGVELEKIRAEIRDVLSRLIAGCERLDMKMAFDVFLDSPDFLMIGADGTPCSHGEYVANNVEYLRNCSSFELTTLSEDIHVLDTGSAVASWVYSAEATLKSGERDVIEKAGATFVFVKRGGEWKVVRYHESALPADRIPAS